MSSMPALTAARSHLSLALSSCSRCSRSRSPSRTTSLALLNRPEVTPVSMKRSKWSVRFTLRVGISWSSRFHVSRTGKNCQHKGEHPEHPFLHILPGEGLVAIYGDHVRFRTETLPHR